MTFDISKLKAALVEAGHAISEGEHLIAQDFQAVEAYAYLVWGLAKDKLHYGLAYPTTLPAGFPGKPEASAETKSDAK